MGKSDTCVMRKGRHQERSGGQWEEGDGKAKPMRWGQGQSTDKGFKGLTLTRRKLFPP